MFPILSGSQQIEPAELEVGVRKEVGGEPRLETLLAHFHAPGSVRLGSAVEGEVAKGGHHVLEISITQPHDRLFVRVRVHHRVDVDGPNIVRNEPALEEGDFIDRGRGGEVLPFVRRCDYQWGVLLVEFPQEGRVDGGFRCVDDVVTIRKDVETGGREIRMLDKG